MVNMQAKSRTYL